MQVLFTVNRKQFKDALLLLKNRQIALEGSKENQELADKLKEYVETIEFCLYKTKLNTFQIDYDFAKQIRSALNKKEK